MNRFLHVTLQKYKREGRSRRFRCLFISRDGQTDTLFREESVFTNHGIERGRKTKETTEGSIRRSGFLTSHAQSLSADQVRKHFQQAAVKK